MGRTYPPLPSTWHRLCVQQPASDAVRRHEANMHCNNKKRSVLDLYAYKDELLRQAVLRRGGSA